MAIDESKWQISHNVLITTSFTKADYKEDRVLYQLQFKPTHCRMFIDTQVDIDSQTDNARQFRAEHFCPPGFC
jgi:hypothetical protein